MADASFPAHALPVERPSVGRPPAWRGRLVAAVFALSIALNVFTIGGFVFARLYLPNPFSPPEERMKMLASRLDLTPPQQEALDRLSGVIRRNHEQLEAANRPTFREVWDDLAQPQPDTAALRALVGQMSETRRSFQQNSSDAMIDFIASLSIPQRQRLATIVLDMHDPTGGPLRHGLGN